MLQAKVAIVTGGGRGIGRAIALALAGKGANVVVNDIDQSVADDVADEVRALGRDGLAIVADVSHGGQVNSMVKQTVDRFGRLDILVNNAGYAIIKPFMDTDEAFWQRMIGVHLFGTMNCCKAALTEMIPRGSGRIVNISSMAGQAGSGGQAIYGAAKAGVIGFTKSLAQEFARYQITVNAVAPGTIGDTALAKEMTAAHPNYAEGVISRVPMRRLGLSADIASAVAFLASDEAGYITGQTLGVNGGLVMM